MNNLCLSNQYSIHTRGPQLTIGAGVAYTGTCDLGMDRQEQALDNRDLRYKSTECCSGVSES